MSENRPKLNGHRKSSCPDGWMPAGYSVPIRLTVRQETYCRRAIGVNRFVYNLCVATHRFCRTNRMPWPSWQDISKAFNACKHEDYPFATEVASRVAEGAFMDFGTAVKNWRDSGHRAGAPRFRKKSRTGAGSFMAASGVVQIRTDGKRRVRLPRIGSVKLAHTLPEGIPYEAHIKRQYGRWYLSVKYWKASVALLEPDTRIPVGAVDTGINPHATDSEGQTWENPKAYYLAERKLKRWQRAQSRRTTGSRGWWEAQRRQDRLQRRIVGLRGNAQHQMTSCLIGKYQNLVIEDLNVAGMMRGGTSKAQADAGMGEIKRQLVYKGEWYHCKVVLAHRYYPSSKTCSACGAVNAKLKRERSWQCSACQTVHDRNLNAAVNLRNQLTLPAGSGVTLRDGKALAAGLLCRETGPCDRRTAQFEPSAPTTLTVCGHSESQPMLNVNTP